MQSTKKLIRLFRDLAVLLEEEADRNPVFAEKLGAVLAELPAAKNRNPPKGGGRPSAEHVPDVLAAMQEKGEDEFRFWLRSLDLPTLKAVVKANGFDPAKASQRWTDADKFVTLIADQTSARLRRGSGFLTSKLPNQSE